MDLATQGINSVGLCFIPKPANNHRPYILRHKPLAIVSTLLLTVKIIALGLVAITPATAELSTITTERIIQLTNVERKKIGIGEVKMSSKLSSAALQKGQHMLQEDYFSHISPSGVTPWFWMSKVGYNYTVAGENLAIDFTSAEDVTAAWMASPTHRDNLLLKDYTDIGIGVVTGEFQGGTSTIVVQMFGRPVGAQSEVKATTAPKASPTPSPSPSATPSPIPPTPLPPAPSVPPPRTPRIAITSPLVGATIDLSIEGEAGSTVHLLVNSQERKTIALESTGSVQTTLAIEDIPDGTFVLRSYATNQTGLKSTLSDPVQLSKDTVSPALENVTIAFAVSPLFDTTTLATYVAGSDAGSIAITTGETETTLVPGVWEVAGSANDTFSIQFRDGARNTATIPIVTRAPQFAIPENQSFPEEIRQYWSVSRHLTAVVFGAMVLLLSLAIFIRIRIQHIDLITHASFVVLLAGVLFLF